MFTQHAHATWPANAGKHHASARNCIMGEDAAEWNHKASSLKFMVTRMRHWTLNQPKVEFVFTKEQPLARHRFRVSSEASARLMRILQELVAESTPELLTSSSALNTNPARSARLEGGHDGGV